MATSAIPILAAADAPTLGFFDIMRRLGTYGRSAAWQTKYLDGLIDRYGFPKPLPLEHRGKWIEAAHPKARWNRRAVEAWELDRLPPAAAAQVDAHALEAAGDRMNDRAAAMFGPAANDWNVEFPATGGMRV